MNGIQIQVIGQAGSGKTAVSQEIVDALRNLGFAVKWDTKPDHINESAARRDGLTRMQVLERVVDTSPIVVKEVQAAKDFNASLNYRVQSYNKKEQE